MDFPKSVPGVGLVGGKFFNEDPVNGIPGSLIPAEWGNSVTEELLNVIEAAGLEPDENNTAQLLAALQLLFPKASTTEEGVIRIATEAQAKALQSELLAITPATLGAVLGTLVQGIPGATFSEVAALTADEGPIVVHDMCGTAWTWIETPYFTGYRSKYCGMWMDGWTPTPLPFQIEATGGTWSESNEKERRVIARYRESGLVVPAAEWIKGQNMIADIGGGAWKAPDLQDMFKRMTGTDVDTANARELGTKQLDALQNIEGSIGSRSDQAGAGIPGAIFSSSGAFASATKSGPGSANQLTSGLPSAALDTTTFNASRVARTSSETRGKSTAVTPFIHV